MLGVATRANPQQSFERHAGPWLGGFLTDNDFIDLLRVCQLAIIKGELKKEDLSEFSRLLAAEYPAGEPRINDYIAWAGRESSVEC